MEPTAEGIVCTACRHYVLLHVGLLCDDTGAPLCVSCASCAGLLDPRRGRSAKRGSFASSDATNLPAAINGAEAAAVAATAAHGDDPSITAAASSDLASALAHLERAGRVGDERAQELKGHMRASGLALADIAASGVLAAFDEARAILGELRDAPTPPAAREGRPPPASICVALAVFDELVRRWDAQVPMGLLRALHEAAMPPAEGSPTALLQPDDGEQVGELVARLRERYARCFELQKLRVDRRAEPGRRVITGGDDEYGGATASKS